MTPYELYFEYRNLNVMLSDWRMVYGIDVHEYRNAELGNDFSVSAGMEEFGKLKNKIVEYGERLGDKIYKIEYPILSKKERQKTPYVPIWVEYVKTFPDLMGVYNGKGSPALIKQALRLSVAFGLVKGNVPDIQRYCDKNIGIDCSGFAGNFLGGDYTYRGASQFAATGKLSRLEDVRPGTVIVWKSGTHVAVIDKITNTESTSGMIYSVDCMVAESTGDKMVEGGPDDGLNYTEYSLLFDGAGNVFKILRSLARAKAGIYDVKVHLANH